MRETVKWIVCLGALGLLLVVAHILLAHVGLHVEPGGGL
jgi:hypothetical protein